MFVGAGRLGIRRRSTPICGRRTKFSAFSWALDLKSEARACPQLLRRGEPGLE
jgi:hypothetical protein